jgi:hypothetical protein
MNLTEAQPTIKGEIMQSQYKVDELVIFKNRPFCTVYPGFGLGPPKCVGGLGGNCAIVTKILCRSTNINDPYFNVNDPVFLIEVFLNGCFFLVEESVLKNL